MKNKMMFLIKNSLKKKMKSKWFLAANIIFAVVVIGLINIDSVITFFGGDFGEKQNIIVVDKTGEAFNLLKTQVDTYEKEKEDDEKTEVKLSKKEEKEEQDGLKESDNILVVIDTDDQEFIKAKIISQTNIDPINYQILQQQLSATKMQYALSKSDIDKEELTRILSPITVDRIIVDENKIDENQNLIMTTIFPTLILPFFMLIIFLIQMIGSEINEEKSSRSMEIIISNVSPKAHFFAKILAGNIFVITQTLLLLLFVVIGIVVRMTIGAGFDINSLGLDTGAITSSIPMEGISNIGNILAYIIPLTLVLIVLSFIAYSLLAGILAAMTNSIEDFQQIQTPIMLVLLASYYLSFMAGMFDGSLFIRVLSYVPFISFLLSPTLFVIGQTSIIDIIISVVILIAFIFIFLKFGLKVYKAGILNYSTDKLWKRVGKIIKKENL